MEMISHYLCLSLRLNSMLEKMQLSWRHFPASPRIEVLSEDYNITATVTSVTIGSDPFTIPLGQVGSTSETGGSVSSLPYSRMDLEVSNPSTSRNIEAGEEATLQFTIFNDGNRVDNLEVEILNLQEIEDAGFSLCF